MSASNTVHTKKRLTPYLPHVKTLSVKEPYASWHTSTFEKSFEDFPEDFKFTHLSGFKFEAMKSVIRMQEMIDTLKFVHSKLPTEETRDVEIIRGIVLRQKLAERIAQNKVNKAEKEATEKAQASATEGENSSDPQKPSIKVTDFDTGKEMTDQLLANGTEQPAKASETTANPASGQSLGKRKATDDDADGSPAKKLQLAPSMFGSSSWSWSNLPGSSNPTEEDAFQHKPVDHTQYPLKRKGDLEKADDTELARAAKRTKTGIENSNIDDSTNGNAANDDAKDEKAGLPVQNSSTAIRAVNSGKRNADEANLEDPTDEQSSKKNKTSDSSEGDSGYVTDLEANARNESGASDPVEEAPQYFEDDEDDEDGLVTTRQGGRIQRRRLSKKQERRFIASGCERHEVLPHYMTGAQPVGTDIDYLNSLRFSRKQGRTLLPGEPDDSESEESGQENADGSYDDGVEDYEDGDGLAVADTPIVLSRIDAAGEAEITEMLNLEDEEKEELLKGVVLPKSMMVQGLCIKRLQLKNLGAVGQRLLWTIAELFPGITYLDLETGPKGAARRWLLGPFNESFRNFRHLRKLHELTTNYTVYIPTSSVPVDYNHAPIPDKAQVKIKTQPKAASRKKKWKKQVRPLERVKLFLDRSPRQFSRRFAAMVCRDQWLTAQKFILREVGKCFATVEEGGNGNALPLNHLVKLTFHMGETRKHSMSVAIDRSSDACLVSRDPASYVRKGMKLTAEIPYDFLFLGIRTRKETKNMDEETRQAMRAETEAEEEDAAELEKHGNKGHVTWYSADLGSESGAPQPFNHYNLHKTRRDFDFERFCRYVSWDW